MSRVKPAVVGSLAKDEEVGLICPRMARVNANEESEGKDRSIITGSLLVPPFYRLNIVPLFAFIRVIRGQIVFGCKL